MSMEERQEIQVKTLPWMSEDDTKHTSKAKKKIPCWLVMIFIECTQKALV